MSCVLTIKNPVLLSFLDNKKEFNSFEEFQKNYLDKIRITNTIPFENVIKEITPIDDGYSLDNSVYTLDGLFTISMSGYNTNNLKFYLNDIINKYREPTGDSLDDRKKHLKEIQDIYTFLRSLDDFEPDPNFVEKVWRVTKRIEDSIIEKDLEDETSDATREEENKEDQPYIYTLAGLYDPTTNDTLSVRDKWGILRHNVVLKVEELMRDGYQFGIQLVKDDEENYQRIDPKDIKNYGVVGVLYQRKNNEDTWEKVYIERPNYEFNGDVKLTTDSTKASKLGVNNSINYTFVIPKFDQPRYERINPDVLGNLISIRNSVENTGGQTDIFPIYAVNNEYPFSNRQAKYEERAKTARHILAGKSPDLLTLSEVDRRFTKSGNLYLRLDGSDLPLNRGSLNEDWRRRMFTLTSFSGYNESEAKNVTRLLNKLMDFQGGDIFFVARNNKIVPYRKSKRIKGQFARLESPEEITKPDDFLDTLEYARINVNKEFLDAESTSFPIIIDSKLKYTSENFREFYLDHHTSTFRQLQLGDKVFYGPVKSLLFNVENTTISQKQDFIDSPKIDDFKIESGITSLDLLKKIGDIQGASNETKTIFQLINALVESNEDVKRNLEDYKIILGDKNYTDSSDKTIHLNLQKVINNPDIVSHELIHALTIDWLNKNEDHEITKKLDSLLDKVPDKVKNIIKKAGYDINDKSIFRKELLARLSDTNVVRELKKVDSSLLDKIIDFFKKILEKIFPQLEDSLYKDLLNMLVEISIAKVEPTKGYRKYSLKDKSKSGYEESDLKDFIDSGHTNNDLNVIVKSIDGELSNYLVVNNKLQDFLDGRLDFKLVFEDFFDDYLLTKMDEGFFSKEEADKIEEAILKNGEFIRDYWADNTSLVKIKKAKIGLEDTLETKDIIYELNDSDDIIKAEKQEESNNIFGGEEEVEKTKDFDKSGMEFSSLESADPMARAFVKLLPQIERTINGVKKYTQEEFDKSSKKELFIRVGNEYLKYQTNDYGFVVLNDYTSTWNKIAKIFADKLTIEEMLDTIDLAKNPLLIERVPEIFVFKNRLTLNVDNFSKARLISKIHTSFLKANVDHQVLLETRKKPDSTFVLINESKDVSQVGRRLINSSFLESINDKLSKYYNSETDSFDAKSFLVDTGFLDKDGKNLNSNKNLIKELGFGLHDSTLDSKEAVSINDFLINFLFTVGSTPIRIADFISEDQEVNGKTIYGGALYLKNLLLREDSFRPLNNSTMIKNAEGENQSTLSVMNAILQSRIHYNNSKSLEDLNRRVRRTKNPMFKYSITKSQLFKESGEGEYRTDIQVEVGVLSGLKLVQQGRASQGNLTIDLDESQWLKTNFLSLLEKGIIENTRAETASTCFYFKLSSWGISSNDFTPVTLQDISDVFNSNTQTFDFSNKGRIYEIWANYLKGELERIDLQNRETPKWGLFADILNAEEKKIALTDKNREFAFLPNALERFFSEEFISYSKKIGGIKSNLPNKIGRFNDIKSDLNKYKAFVFINSMIIHTEEVILFQGDLSQTPKYFKRAKGVQSTGIPVIISPALSNFINERLKNNSFARLIGYGFSIGETYKSATIKDDEQESTFKQNLIDGYILSKQESNAQLGIVQSEKDLKEEAETLLTGGGGGLYANVNIGDGGGFVSPDMYWAVLNLVGNINEEQNLVYHALLLDAKANLSKYLGDRFKSREQKLTPQEEEIVKKGFEILSKGKGQLPLVKFTYRGNMVSDDTVQPEVMDKFALFPLFPQFVKDKPAAKALLITLLEKNLGYVKFKSGTKIDSTPAIDFFGNLDNLANLHVEFDAKSHELNTEYLREQIRTPYKHKLINTFGTQFRKNIIGNLANIRLASEDYAGQTVEQWINLNKRFSELTKKEVLGRFGISVVDGMTDYSNLNKAKVAEVLIEEAKKRDLPLNILSFFEKNKDYLNNNSLDENYSFIESSLGAQQVQNLLASIIKKISIQKLNGAQYRQVPSSLFDRSQKRGTRELAFYRMQDGQVLAAECKIGMGGDFFNLLNLPEVKDKIKPEDTLFNKIDILNDLLQDDAFVEKHKDVLTIIAYRIPNQGFNSDEVLIIREFLPPMHSGEIILPPEITTKSGTDYDYDKMSAIIPSIDKKGQLETSGKNGIQNEMIKTSAKILLDRVNFSKLITPNSNAIIFDFLKGTEETEGLLKTLGIAVKDPSPTKIITIDQNLKQFLATKGKNLLGIAAVWNPFSVLLQQHHIEINDYYNRRIGYKNDRIRVYVNPLLSGNKEAFKAFTVDGINKLEIISQLINVTVDMPSDDTFGKTIFGQEDFAAFIYSMSALNYPFKETMYLFHQPIIYEFKRLISAKIQSGMTRNRAVLLTLVDMLNIDKDIISKDGKVVLQEVERVLFEEQGVLDKYEERLNVDSLKSDLVQIDKITLKDVYTDQQRSVLAHYIKLLDQSSQVRTVQSSLNFDTSPDNSMMKVMTRNSNREDALAAGIIPKDKIEEIRQDSVISGLFVSDVLEDIISKVFPILFSQQNREVFSTIVSNFTQRSEDAYRKAFNDFLLAVVQNYGTFEGKNVFDIGRNLLKGKDKLSIIRRAREIKNELDSNGTPMRLLNVITANIQKLDKDSSDVPIINIQLLLGLENSSDDKNRLTEEFRQLLNSENTKHSQFAKDLAIAGIVQSGWSKSPLYFSDVIPEEFISPIFYAAFDKFDRMKEIERGFFRKRFVFLFNQYESRSLGKKIDTTEDDSLEEKADANKMVYLKEAYRLMDFTSGMADFIKSNVEEIQNNLLEGDSLNFEELPNVPNDTSNVSSDKDLINQYVDRVLYGEDKPAWWGTGLPINQTSPDGLRSYDSIDKLLENLKREQNKISEYIEQNESTADTKHIEELSKRVINYGALIYDISNLISQKQDTSITKVDKSMSWEEIKKLPVYSDRGIMVMRKQGTNEHFGNPFTGSGVSGLIQTKDVQSAVEAYKDWLLNDYVLYEDKNGVTKEISEGFKKEQRDWILSQIEQGKLDNQTLLYMNDKGEYYSHADVLADIVNSISKESLQQSNVETETPIERNQDEEVLLERTIEDLITKHNYFSREQTYTEELIEQKMNSMPKRYYATAHGNYHIHAKPHTDAILKQSIKLSEIFTTSEEPYVLEVHKMDAGTPYHTSLKFSLLIVPKHKIIIHRPTDITLGGDGNYYFSWILDNTKINILSKYDPDVSTIMRFRDDFIMKTSVITGPIQKRAKPFKYEGEVYGILLLNDSPEDVIYPSELMAPPVKAKILGAFSKSLTETLVTFKDDFKYYGTTYKITLDKDKKAIDVPDLKQGQSETNTKFNERKQKILDAYNTNPNVDPQNGKPFRSTTEALIAGEKQSNPVEKSFTFKDGYKVPIRFTLNTDQIDALNALEDFIKSNKKTITLSGYAGTGKSSLISILDTWLKHKYIFPKYSAPTHRANAVTKLMNPGVKVYTLHSLFGLTPDIDFEQGNFDVKDIEYAQKNKQEIKKDDVLIIDEASLVNDTLYEFIRNAQERLDIKVIYVGDEGQLKPVKQGTKSKVFTDSTHKVIQLTKVERTGDNAILRESTNIRNGQDWSYTTDINSENQGVMYIDTNQKMFSIIEENFRIQEGLDNKLFFRILGATNSAVSEINSYARKILYENSDDQLLVGDVLMGYSNFDYDYNTKQYKLYNGGDYVVTSVKPTNKLIHEIGETFNGFQINIKNLLNPKEQEFSLFVASNNEDISKFIKLADMIQQLQKLGAYALSTSSKDAGMYFQQATDLKKQVALMQNITKLDPKDSKVKVILEKTFDYGYAHTIHKSQGGTYDRVMILADTINKFPDESSRQELKYVAISRARNIGYVYTTHEIKSTKQLPSKAEDENLNCHLM